MAFESTALRIASLVFLFIARIRFPASYSLLGVLRKRYGRDLVKEVRTLEKLDFKHKKAILDLDFLISCRKNSVFPKFLQFKVSNKQLRASRAYISCQKRLLNQEINNKQKAVKSIQQKVKDCYFLHIIYFFHIFIRPRPKTCFNIGIFLVGHINPQNNNIFTSPSIWMYKSSC